MEASEAEASSTLGGPYRFAAAAAAAAVSPDVYERRGVNASARIPPTRPGMAARERDAVRRRREPWGKAGEFADDVGAPFDSAAEVHPSLTRGPRRRGAQCVNLPGNERKRKMLGIRT